MWSAAHTTHRRGERRVSVSTLALPVLLALALIGVLLALRDWRTGVMLLLVWLVFEDLPRKYLGNNLLIFFGKDLLAGAVYISFLLQLAARRVRLFQASFLVPLYLFMGLGVVQVLNPHSPNLLYGVMGLKIYFYYVPLMFVGHALIRNHADLDRLLITMLSTALVVAALGLTQAVVGIEFLTPQELAPELEALGRELRTAPISGLSFYRPTSVFVSEARFGSYMFLMFVLAIGTWAYTSLARRRWEPLAGATVIFTALGLFVHGSRAGVLFGSASAVVMCCALFGTRLLDRASRVSLARQLRVMAAAVGVAAAGYALAFPDVVVARWAQYAETLSPFSPASELFWRVWGYPWMNLQGAFGPPTWLVGQGIGVASLGVQYLAPLVGAPSSGVVESGYGTLVLELGIGGLILWIVWSTVLVSASVRAVSRLAGRETLPIGVSILWFAFLLLFPFTFGALSGYQNYLSNALFWLLVGVLFRLPTLANEFKMLRST